MMSSTASDSTLAFASHDHSHCAGDVLAQAEAISLAKGARLTPVRRRTLELLLEGHRAMGAYDVLERLAAEGYGKQPPVAYRALEFLVDLGLVHRINRLNAFAACTHPGQTHTPAFLICRICHLVAETPATRTRAALEATAAESGFVVEFASFEAVGRCPGCADVAEVDGAGLGGVAPA